MAKSSRLREDYRIIARNSKKEMTPGQYLQFLSSASEILPDSDPREHREYKKIKI